MRAVHVHIDRIAVEGLDEMQQRQFARTLEEHLRVWAAGGGATGMTGETHAKIPALNAGQLKPGASARQAATQVVNSLARRLGANGRNGRPANAGGKGAQNHV